ncbi:DUF456 domain-containing protein [Luteolibacter algae]|uniref:DUF456 domain-containing protein n=1 Tax=Luteolibacter algae TaxID=454151 RepID=A0ABW5DAY2_9BACT
MMDFIQDSGIWIVTGSLLLLGLVGCVLPILPGHLIILAGAIGYRLMAGAEAGILWWGWAILIGLMAVSQIFEIMSGSLGSKWFGGTKWGAIGALIGSIVGLFFMPFGLLIGPLVGAFGFEMAFAKQKSRPAVVSGVGSVVGTLAGMGFKIAVGVLMIAWFFIDVFLIG